MLTLLLASALAAAVSSPGSLEPVPHVRAVYARQDGPDVGEFIEIRNTYPGQQGLIIAAVDGNGVFAALWNFSQETQTDYQFILGGPAVPNRHADLSSGIGPAISGTSDFIPNGTVTVLAWYGSATFGAYLETLVGLDVDADGDGITMFEDPTAPPHTVLGALALVDGTWPASSSVYDCAPLVGPDGLEAPAGAVYTSNLGACMDAWLRSDGSNVTPGLTEPGPCLFAAQLGIECGEGLFGTPYCEGSGASFSGSMAAWGSPMFGDQNLSVGALGTGDTQVTLASIGRDVGALPGVSEPFCLAAPFVRVPGVQSANHFSTFFEVDLGQLQGSLPVMAGGVLCFQTWHRFGSSTPRLARPVAVVLR